MYFVWKTFHHAPCLLLFQIDKEVFKLIKKAFNSISYQDQTHHLTNNGDVIYSDFILW